MKNKMSTAALPLGSQGLHVHDYQLIYILIVKRSLHSV